MYREFFKKYKEDALNCLRDLKDPKKRIKQIPNLLTASRAIGPFFIVPTALMGNLPAAALLTVLFAATDGLDGFFARKLDATSDFGRELDPIVDKFFAARSEERRVGKEC